MNIGQAAQASGLSSKTIRYYESVDLIGQPNRAANGYREYNDFDVEVLHFIARARATGFSLPETRQLLSLYLQPNPKVINRYFVDCRMKFLMLLLGILCCFNIRCGKIILMRLI